MLVCDFEVLERGEIQLVLFVNQIQTSHIALLNVKGNIGGAVHSIAFEHRRLTHRGTHPIDEVVNIKLSGYLVARVYSQGMV